MSTIENWIKNTITEAVQTAVRAELDGIGVAPKPTLGLLTKKQCAEALGVSVASVDRFCAQKRIPFSRIGGRRRFDLAAVRAALAA